MKDTMSFVARTAQLLSKHPTMRVNACAAVNYVNQKAFCTQNSDNDNLLKDQLQEYLKKQHDLEQEHLRLTDEHIRNSMSYDYSHILESAPSEHNKYFFIEEQALSKPMPSARLEELKNNRDAFDELTKKDRTSLFADQRRAKNAKDLSNLFHSYVREEERKESEKSDEERSR